MQMQVEIDVAGRPVVVFGRLGAARRLVRRYAASGARVRHVVSGAGPRPGEEVPGVAYESRPDPDDEAVMLDLLAAAWLVVLVGLEAEESARLRRLAGSVRALVIEEPPATAGGSVTLVGGGPGATSLLTLGACAALRDADVVCYDRLAPTTELVRLAPAAELVDVGKRPYHHPVSQPEINRLLVQRAQAGQAVVRLKGGDCFVFGRGGEEVGACLAAGVPVRVVPGVSSALAVPAAAGIPVTHRGISHAVTVLSGHVPPSQDELAGLAALGGTLVILMGILNLPQITAGLLAAGLDPDTSAAVVERGFSDSQRTTCARLGGLAAEARRVDVQSPAVVVIGEVAGLAGWSASEAWAGALPQAQDASSAITVPASPAGRMTGAGPAETTPGAAGLQADSLRGFRIGVTSDRRSGDLIAAFERRGASVLHAPALSIAPNGHDSQLVDETRALIAARPDTVLVTTGYGMRRWFEVADAAGLGGELTAVLDQARVLARGPQGAGRRPRRRPRRRGDERGGDHCRPGRPGARVRRVRRGRAAGRGAAARLHRRGAAGAAARGVRRRAHRHPVPVGGALRRRPAAPADRCGLHRSAGRDHLHQRPRR